MIIRPDRWQFRDTSTRSWHPATVPGCVHTDLLAAGLIPDPFHGTNELGLQWIEERAWEYRTAFTVSAAVLADERVELCADGLDTVATVFLNGTELARTDNMFLAHRWHVRPLLRPGRNELRIVFASALETLRHERTDFTVPREFNDPVGHCVRLRKQQCQFGWDWGPRFVTAGIWRDLRIESGRAARLATVRVTQHHRADRATVTLTVTPEVTGAGSGSSAGLTYDLTLALAGQPVAHAEGAGPAFTLEVTRPQLWWPAGQGAQPLYDLRVVARAADRSVVGQVDRRVGLRTIELDRSPDEWGESFRFVVNGRPVFIKGANWIPAHSFVAGLLRADYARDLTAARDAHLNLVRVWGGGIYEAEDFYDLCDELGLLVWQDFMFACTLYPGDEAFAASVAAEAAQQVRRLHHRACLALWCGNNEIAQLNPEALKPGPFETAYRRIFHDILPAAVAAHDGLTPYWPSSQWRGDGDNTHEAGTRRGDTHYWDVWHARHPVKDYEKWLFRFCSEFGMQSYSSSATNATFCPPGQTNVFGPVMENHQKNRAGNQIILDYVSRRYRYPKDQDALILLSQFNQAHCMQTGVEHYRRNQPRCMGAVYWQLNDCWPVASWSSLEFTGRWKAIHHAARRFYAPLLVSAHVPGEEGAIIGNYRTSTVREVHLHTIYDALPPGADPTQAPPAALRARLRWALVHLDGRVLQRGHRALTLRFGEARRQHTLDLAAPLAHHGRDQVYLRLTLEVAGEAVSRQTVFLTPPRFIDLPRAPIRRRLRLLAPGRARLTLVSPVFQANVWIESPLDALRADDNAFDLHPDEPREILLTFPRRVSLATLKRGLTVTSLADTYAG